MNYYIFNKSHSAKIAMSFLLLIAARFFIFLLQKFQVKFDRNRKRSSATAVK